MGRGNRGDCRGVHALRGAILQRRVIPTEHLASVGKHKWSRPPALEAVPGLSRDARAPEAANCSPPRVQGAWEGWDWGPVQRVAMGQEEGPGREQCGEGHRELRGPNMEPGDHQVLGPTVGSRAQRVDWGMASKRARWQSQRAGSQCGRQEALRCWGSGK